MTRKDFLQIIADTPETLRIAAQREAIVDANRAASDSVNHADPSWMRRSITPRSRIRRGPDPDAGPADA